MLKCVLKDLFFQYVTEDTFLKNYAKMSVHNGMPTNRTSREFEPQFGQDFCHATYTTSSTKLVYHQKLCHRIQLFSKFILMLNPPFYFDMIFKSAKCVDFTLRISINFIYLADKRH